MPIRDLPQLAHSEPYANWWSTIQSEPYAPFYAEFLARSAAARGGYEFQHPAVRRNVPPPTIAFARPLRWWSLDRPKRLAALMRWRDRLQEAILTHRTGAVPVNRGQVSRHPKPASSDVARSRAGWAHVLAAAGTR